MDRTTMTDAEGYELGADLARSDLSCGRPAATDASILESLEDFADDENVVGGWAQDAAIRAYRRAYVEGL